MVQLANTSYYTVSCSRKGKEKSIRLNGESSEEIVSFVLRIFKNRLNPPKDSNNRCKSRIPYSIIKVYHHASEDSRPVQLTFGNIYNYSPTQVIEAIKKALK